LTGIEVLRVLKVKFIMCASYIAEASQVGMGGQISIRKRHVHISGVLCVD